MTTNKILATEFQTMIVAGNIDEAYEKYVDMDGKHHNAYFPAGFAALQAAMKENHQQFPNKQLQIQHVLGDGELVAVHLYRFENEKIVEMWDVGQAIPVDVPNTDGMF